MVLNFEKKIFEILNTEENKEELKKLVHLISNNFSESMYCDNYIQNFIFLDIDTCEYLIKISENEYFQRYYDNFYMIESRITNIKKDIFKIVYEISDPCMNQIKYEYSVIKELISKKVKIIVENINDRYVYEPLINSCKDPNLKLDIDFLVGNGGQIPDFLESRKDKKEINLVITDMDKKFPREHNRRSTPYKVEKKIEELNLNYRHITLNFKNIEGLIPFKVIKEKSSKIFDRFDEYYSKSDHWIIYFDFKKGIEKNIYSKKNDQIKIVRESLEWWNEALDDIQLEEKVRNMSDKEVFKTGISLAIDSLGLTEEDFKKNSSDRQKEEYNRIYSLIYPYIVVNDYGII